MKQSTTLLNKPTAKELKKQLATEYEERERVKLCHNLNICPDCGDKLELETKIYKIFKFLHIEYHTGYYKCIRCGYKHLVSLIANSY
jgi:C4-type Zn-finger protein